MEGGLSQLEEVKGKRSEVNGMWMFVGRGDQIMFWIPYSNLTLFSTGNQQPHRFINREACDGYIMQVLQRINPFTGGVVINVDTIITGNV